MPAPYQPVSIDPWSKDIARWNRAHQEGKYDNTRLSDFVSMWMTEDGDPVAVAAGLRLCADIIEDPTCAAHPIALADVYCFLDAARGLVPEAECWVVTKHYHCTDPTSVWYGKTATWVGCLSEDQAKDVCAAVDAHYARKYPHLTPDTWTVDRGTIRASHILRPDVTGADYVKRLG